MHRATVFCYNGHYQSPVTHKNTAEVISSAVVFLILRCIGISEFLSVKEYTEEKSDYTAYDVTHLGDTVIRRGECSRYLSAEVHQCNDYQRNRYLAFLDTCKSTEYYHHKHNATCTYNARAEQQTVYCGGYNRIA